MVAILLWLDIPTHICYTLSHPNGLREADLMAYMMMRMPRQMFCCPEIGRG